MTVVHICLHRSNEHIKIYKQNNNSWSNKRIPKTVICVFTIHKVNKQTSVL